MLTFTEDDVTRVVEAALAAEITSGKLIHNVGAWQAKYRQQVLRNEEAWPGFILKTVAAIDPDPRAEGGRAARRLRQPAEVLRRLYRAKLDDLARVGVPAHERTAIALDYACGEIHRCDIAPMPPRGVVALEDELRSEIEALS